MKPNVVREKSFEFAVEVVILCRQLKENREYVLSNQLLRSGTSIGANIREAEHAVSTRDFLNKLSIALKEANETRYWLELIERVTIAGDYPIQRTLLLIDEILRLLISIIKSLKQKS